MRTITGKNVERDFTTQAIERDFSPEMDRRSFTAKRVLRNFGVHNPLHIQLNQPWLWGDEDKILSEIQGTFADQL